MSPEDDSSLILLDNLEASPDGDGEGDDDEQVGEDDNQPHHEAWLFILIIIGSTIGGYKVFVATSCTSYCSIDMLMMWSRHHLDTASSGGNLNVHLNHNIQCKTLPFSNQLSYLVVGCKITGNIIVLRSTDVSDITLLYSHNN